MDIKKNNADARTPEATGEALGSNATAIVNVVTALSEGKAKFVPDVLVASGGNGGGAFEGLAATAMRFFGNGGSIVTKPAVEGPPVKGSGKETPIKS